MREKQQKRNTKRICRSLWLLVELNSLRPSNFTLESVLIKFSRCLSLPLSASFVLNKYLFWRINPEESWLFHFSGAFLCSRWVTRCLEWSGMSVGFLNRELPVQSFTAIYSCFWERSFWYFSRFDNGWCLLTLSIDWLMTLSIAKIKSRQNGKVS